MRSRGSGYLRCLGAGSSSGVVWEMQAAGKAALCTRQGWPDTCATIPHDALCLSGKHLLLLLVLLLGSAAGGCQEGVLCVG